MDNVDLVTDRVSSTCYLFYNYEVLIQYNANSPGHRLRQSV